MSKTPPADLLTRLADKSIALRYGHAPHGQVGVGELVAAITDSAVRSLEERRIARVAAHAMGAEVIPAVVPVPWKGGWRHLCSREYMLGALGAYGHADEGAAALSDHELQVRYGAVTGGTLTLYSQWQLIVLRDHPNAMTPGGSSHHDAPEDPFE